MKATGFNQLLQTHVDIGDEVGMVFLEMFLLEAVGGLRLFLGVNTKNTLTINWKFDLCVLSVFLASGGRFECYIMCD